MDHISSCIMLHKIISRLDRDEINKCRLVNRRFQAVISENHLIKRIQYSTFLKFQFNHKDYKRVLRDSVQINLNHSGRMKVFLIDETSIYSQRINSDETLRDVERMRYLGGIEEGLKKLMSRIFSHNYFLHISLINACENEGWSRTLALLFREYKVWCHYIKFQDSVNLPILRSIKTGSLRMINVMSNLDEFMEINLTWNRLIGIRNVDKKDEWIESLLGLLKRWQVGLMSIRGFLVVFSPKDNGTFKFSRKRLIASLLSLPAFSISLGRRKRHHKYIEACIRRENIVEGEEGTETVLILKMTVYDCLVVEEQRSCVPPGDGKVIRKMANHPMRLGCFSFHLDHHLRDFNDHPKAFGTNDHFAIYSSPQLLPEFPI